MSAGGKPNARVIGFRVIFASDVFRADLGSERSQCPRALPSAEKVNSLALRIVSSASIPVSALMMLMTDCIVVIPVLVW